MYQNLQEYEESIENSKKAIEHYEMIMKLDQSNQQENIYSIYGAMSMLRAEVSDTMGDLEKTRDYLLEAIRYYNLSLEHNPTNLEHLKR